MRENMSDPKGLDKKQEERFLMLTLKIGSRGLHNIGVDQTGDHFKWVIKW